MSAEEGGEPKDESTLQITVNALSVQLASIRKLCEAGWMRGEPCPLCKRLGVHSDVCYARTATGYDLLEEHAATLRENHDLRVALAQRLPVNGERILAGGKYQSLRKWMQGGRFSRHES